MTEALQRASDRGVNLHLLIDLSRQENQDENPAAISRIRSFIGPNSEVVTVTSDAGTTAINHNKFVLFSELSTGQGRVQHVVFQTSYNFTAADAEKIQDALILPHAGLYRADVDYWQVIKAKATTGMKDFFSS